MICILPSYTVMGRSALPAPAAGERETQDQCNTCYSFPHVVTSKVAKEPCIFPVSPSSRKGEEGRRTAVYAFAAEVRYMPVKMPMSPSVVALSGPQLMSSWMRFAP